MLVSLIPSLEYDFCKRSNNLYILQLDKDVDVEKLYDSNVLQTKVDQRTFNPSNKKTDQTKFYGKKEFLEKVIEPNRSSINFSNFEIVFKTLNHIQLYHLIAYRSEAGLAAKTNLSLISAKSSNTT